MSKMSERSAGLSLGSEDGVAFLHKNSLPVKMPRRFFQRTTLHHWL
jgi:hypothetical protein